MDEMMSKIQGMLSDEESMQQIKELAAMFMNSSEEADADSEGGESTKPESSDSGGDGIFNIGTLMKLASLFNSPQEEDKNMRLLLALKPFLKEERQPRVDKALKMLKLYAVWSVVKDSGMLENIF